MTYTAEITIAAIVVFVALCGMFVSVTTDAERRERRRLRDRALGLANEDDELDAAFATLFANDAEYQEARSQACEYRAKQARPVYTPHLALDSGDDWPGEERTMASEKPRKDQREQSEKLAKVQS